MSLFRVTMCRALFDPSKHIGQGQLVIMNMSEGGERRREPNSGVDIAIVDRVYNDPVNLGKKLMDVTYHAPKGLVPGTQGHSDKSHWPSDWTAQRLVPWLVRLSNTRRSTLGHHKDKGVSVDVVPWSCNVTSSKLVHKQQQKTLLAQWKRTIRHVRGISHNASSDAWDEGDTLDDDDDNDDVFGM
jgi:hypothetical protein